MATTDGVDGPAQSDAVDFQDEFQDAVEEQPLEKSALLRQKLQRANTSYASVPPLNHLLTGKQEHCKFAPSGCLHVAKFIETNPWSHPQI